MSKRRGKGEGTIARKNGAWCSRATLGVDSAGKQRRKAFYGKTRDSTWYQP